MMTEHLLCAGTVARAGAQRTIKQHSCPKELLLPDQCTQPCLTEVQTTVPTSQPPAAHRVGAVHLGSPFPWRALCPWGLGAPYSVPEENASEWTQ